MNSRREGEPSPAAGRGAGILPVQFTPIGVVRNGITDSAHADWLDVVSEIWVREDLASGLVGLNLFSHLIVIYVLHKATFSPSRELVRQPFHRDDLPRLGVFARRARQRPNPIGLTTVKIREVRDSSVIVEALDAADGTPVLDLKPYNPIYDRVDTATIPDWVDASEDDYL